MKATFYTLGCKVNQYETQIMEQSLAAAGYEIVPPDMPADVCIVNSCTVTAGSDRKTRQIIYRMRAENPGALIVLCGCLAQSDPDAARAVAEADIIAGTKDRARIADIIREALETGRRMECVSPFENDERFEPMKASGMMGHTRAFVKIEDGCRSFCSYCIIPYARGPVRSKPPADIKAEIESLAHVGYREAVLVGINLSSYGADIGAKLTDAVKSACCSGIERVRMGSLEPNIITAEFLEFVASEPAVCPHFHLSLQSGCEKTLRRMNRRYTADRYREAVAALRKAIPGCAVTTDIIVGFPGETQAEFDESLAFAREIGFAQAHVFAYSKRAGTKAADMPNQVTKTEKSYRSRAMIDACLESRRNFLQAHVGKVIPVLYEMGKGQNFDGFAPDYTPVRTTGSSLHRKIVDTLITGFDNDGCTGRPI